MQRENSLEKTLMLGKIEGRRIRGCQRMRWLDGITDAMNMNLGKLQEMVRDREAWLATVYEVTNSRIWLGNSTTAAITCSLLVLYKVKVNVLVIQWYPTLDHLMDCRPPGSSVHGIFQTKILEWVVILFSRGSSQLRDWIQVSCIAIRFFPIWATREAPGLYKEGVNSILKSIGPEAIALINWFPTP